MSSFLQDTANQLLGKYQARLPECAIVFPSRRAGVFFRNFLLQAAPKVMWAPRILTISDLMQEFSSLKLADPLSAVFDLYQVYLSEKKSLEPFDEFYFWGTVMLNDFGEIDKYMIDAKSLFTNLSENRNMAMQFDFLDEEQKAQILKFWDSFSAGSLSTQQENFLRNWDILYPVYDKFRKLLKSESRGYEGMIYREVADMCENGHVGEIPWKKIVFVGFNALNHCEKVMFRWLQRANRADFFWDTDPFYLDNPVHEAGRFLRENIREYGGWTKDDSGMEGGKKIHFVSTSSNVSQAKLVGKLLKQAEPVGDEMNTAIVLPDENLLIPVLSAIPEKYQKVNVTMGLTLKDSPVYQLINHLIQLQRGRDRGGFYFRQVLEILENPVVSSAFSQASDFSETIRKNNMVMVPEGFFTGDERLNAIFQETRDSEHLCRYLIEVLKKLSSQKEAVPEEKTNLNLQTEFIISAIFELQKLLDVLEGKKILIQTDTFSRLLKKVLADVEVSFRGEPLAGIQVMGVLETRLLDFDNLIILSMNEGVFPRKSSTISFLPQSLRRGFGLPSIGHQDAIFSYYFFRLIQRAQNITCVFNTQSGGMKSGEPSRFIHQMKYSGTFQIEESNLTVNATAGRAHPIRVEKTPAIMEQLNSFLEEHAGAGGKYLSPSAINAWLQCKLRFYFRVVAGLREPEELLEEVDARMLGNLLHKSAELLYKPFEGEQLSKAQLDELTKDQFLGELVHKAFEKEFFKGRTISDKELKGRNLIVADILESYLKQILKVDSRLEGLKILALEKRVHGVVETECESKGVRVRIGGVIDRLDETEGVMRIIDYKTGSDQESVKDIPALFEQGNSHGAILQLLLYTLLLQKELNPEKLIVPGLYKMQSLYDDEFDFRFRINRQPFSGARDILEEVNAGLKQVISEIFHPSIHFDQVNDEKICAYCSYRSICFPGRSKVNERDE